MRDGLLGFSLSVLMTCTTACGPGNVIARNKTVDEVDDQQATCKVAKDPLSPLIVEWPASSKVSLDAVSKRGVVVVSYAGCALKILSGCTARGQYQYTSVTPARDKISIESEDDLYARLPLGAVSLKGELARGSRLELDYIAVGQRVTTEPPVDLEGDCEGATHYVRTITIGAYALDAAARARGGAGVDVAGAGVGAERREGDRRLHGSGDVERCAARSSATEDAASSAGCGAPLQLDLSPLHASRKTIALAPATPDGLAGVPDLSLPPSIQLPAAIRDTDGDGIPDRLDKCPNDPEDKDGFQDDDGCPDPDNDADGIPDRVDKCPNEPENFNGYQDDDGCPDTPPGLG